MKFSYREYFMKSINSGCKEEDFTSEIILNVRELIKRITSLGYEPPMYFSSCLRSKDVHKRIYTEKGVPENKIPWGSKHLSGQAADVADPDGKLADWLMINDKKVEESRLWVEHPDFTKGWVHFQSVPPKSGKRFFIP